MLSLSLLAECALRLTKGGDKIKMNVVRVLENFQDLLILVMVTPLIFIVIHNPSSSVRQRENKYILQVHLG